MNDAAIIDAYFCRDEKAITMTKQVYGSRLMALALRILQDRQDAEEAESDTYFKTWQTIPPQRPHYLFAYLAKICRNVSLHRLEWKNAQKRNADVVQLSNELEACIADETMPRVWEAKQIGQTISAFLQGQSKENRVIFIRRYVLAESVEDVARSMGISESKVKSSLFRTRNKLRAWLAKEEIAI